MISQYIQLDPLFNKDEMQVLTKCLEKLFHLFPYILTPVTNSPPSRMNDLPQDLIVSEMELKYQGNFARITEQNTNIIILPNTIYIAQFVVNTLFASYTYCYDTFK